MTPTLDHQCTAALERVQAYINRAAGQHSRAISQGFDTLRARRAAAMAAEHHRRRQQRPIDWDSAPRLRVVAGTSVHPTRSALPDAAAQTQVNPGVAATTAALAVLGILALVATLAMAAGYLTA
jgi:hypothetical protein